MPSIELADQDMNVWAVSFTEESITEELCQAGLAAVDSESQAQIRRFYHKADLYRCLIGRLLPRLLLKELGVPSDEIIFRKTNAGKPFIHSTTRLDRAIGFNISHDSAFIVMAFHSRGLALEGVSRNTRSEGHTDEVSKIGIDIMRIALPPYEKSVRSFVEGIADTLTSLEERFLLDPDKSTAQTLENIFSIWTLKEAYTKAIGFGLGFDFKRIQFDPVTNRLTVDGASPPRGWQFETFTLGLGEDLYQVSVARFSGKIMGEVAHVVKHGLVNDAEWLTSYDAVTLIRRIAGEK